MQDLAETDIHSPIEPVEHQASHTSSEAASIDPKSQEQEYSIASSPAALSALAASFLAACGGGGGGDSTSTAAAPSAGTASTPTPAPPSPTPAPPAPTPAPPTPAPSSTTRAEASRFLGLSSFGATDASIDDVLRLGYGGWVDWQFSLPQKLHMDHIDYYVNTANPGQDAWRYATNLRDSFYMQALRGADQLRQRVVFALSQIFVVSMASNEVIDRSSCHTSFMDMLGRNAFGNFRTLLEEVSTHPMMGVYLSHRANEKEDAVKGTSPDENYAREVMQLFSIGLVKLNADGTPQRDGAGNTFPAYNNADVSGLAKVFTGWSWVPRDSSDYRFYENFPPRNIQVQPMVPYEKHHSSSAKSFLGVTIPAGTTARPSLRIALDTLANHPNTAPFISRQLIQRLVTSNPSKAYVSRVSGVFVSSKGDMKAVIRAILLDDEARLPAKSGDGRHGKVREPVLRVTAWARGFEASSKTGEFRIRQTTQIGQSVMEAPSVFNFYRPGFVPPGSSIATAGLVAPELQINTESQVTAYLNFMSSAVENGTGDNRDVSCSYAAEVALASNPAALIDRVDLLLTGQRLSSATRNSMLKAINSVPATSALQRARTAVLLALCSPEFLVQI
ncbi:DUF1800 domain-containing protein [Variovorax sp. PCZ-1]|uniref:DUF1800 domain-containing protein n=1 Tax=Variovorax sp. PCZ-1 TaxID=2835533 RepID=UPI001BCBE089|nr:DUF1800 domain-containing protein [Variovorax sp. PCZ-1]MBS7807889.1 DUF1800 domain-containing protein [Variovorax sp. PCZ-1]